MEEVTSMVQQPAKVMRIGTMIKQLLEEVRAAPLDESGRARLREIHESSITRTRARPLARSAGRTAPAEPALRRRHPSEAELRIAQAQLVGWLEGLFHGIQAAFAQQVAARQHELEERPRAARAGAGWTGSAGRVVIGPGGQIIAIPGAQGGGPEIGPGGSGTGQYL